MIKVKLVDRPYSFMIHYIGPRDSIRQIYYKINKIGYFSNLYYSW
jgi:hypothetical protein